MSRLFPIAMACGLVACMPPPADPAARGVLPSPKRPPPPVERPADPAPPAPPRGPVQAPTSAHPTPTPDGQWHFDTPALPPAWPASAFDLIAGRHGRRVVATDDVIGVVRQPALIAVSGDGGVFRADAFGRLQAERTTLPKQVSRVFATADALVACAPPLDNARFSVDGGASWGSLAFQCGHDRARTIAGQGPLTYALAGNQLRIGPLPSGSARYRALPVADVEALGAQGDHLLLVGAEALAVSTDAGETFRHLNRPFSVEAVRDVAFVGKGTILLAGTAGRDGVALMRSVDLGRTWRPVPLPRRLDDIAALAVGPTGHLIAVPADALADAAISTDAGASFQPLPPGTLAQGAALATRDGFITGSSDGVLRGVATRAPRLGLSEPLHDAVFTHPQVAVGIGRRSGAFRTLDGGRAWQPIAVGRGVRFWDVSRVADHTVMLVGDGVLWRSEDAGLRWDQRPLPSSCAARWVRFSDDGARGTVGCADGSLLETGDGGRSWQVGVRPPVRLRPVVWYAGKRLALGDDDRLYSDADGTFTPIDSPLPHPVHLTAAPEGISLLAADGRGAWFDGAAWQAHAWVDPPAHARRHRTLSGGAAVVIAGDQVVHLQPDAPPRALAPAPADLRLTGDGGLLLFGAHSSTLLEAR